MPHLPEAHHQPSPEDVKAKPDAEISLWQRIRDALKRSNGVQSTEESRRMVREMESVAKQKEVVAENLIDRAAADLSQRAHKDGLAVDVPSVTANLESLKERLHSDLETFVAAEGQLLTTMESLHASKDEHEHEPVTATVVESPLSQKKTIEQKPFRDLGVQQFLTRWCQANDGIVPVYVSREQWNEQQSKGILIPGKEKKTREKPARDIKRLYIPEDLQLWEMVGVMDAVDRDTYAQKPEKQGEKKAELEKLGITFKNAGTYLAQRLEGVREGKVIAATLAQELYAYGDSLVAGKPASGLPSLEIIAQGELSAEALDETDQWLAGERLYNARKKRAHESANDSNDGDATEKMRQRTLNQFFRITEKARALTLAHEKDGESVRPLSPLHEAFINKINAGLELQIEKPRTELMSAVFRRGLEKLANEMNDPAGTNDWRNKVDSAFKKMGFDLKISEKKLRDTLKISEMKQQLAEVRATGDVQKIAEKEREFALRIQAEVSKLKYESKVSNPADIAAAQKLNCVGYTTVGVALNESVGLDMLVVDQPQHSTSFLATSDGRVYTNEMQGGPSLNEVRDENVTGTHPDGRPIKVADLVRLSQKKGNVQRLTFELTDPKIVEQYGFVYKTPGGEQSDPCVMSAYSANAGMPEAILHNLQYVLESEGLLYTAIGDKNIPEKLYIDGKLQSPTKSEASNDNLFAARNESNRVAYSVTGGQALKSRRWEKSHKIKKFDFDSLDERDFAKRATTEKRKNALSLLSKAHDLRHKGYVEEAVQAYRQFLTKTNPEKDKDIIVLVEAYINELVKRR